MTDLAALVVSAAVAAAIAPGALRALAAAGRTRPNWRGRAVVFPGGVVAVVAALLALAPLAIAQRALDRALLGDAALTLALPLGVAFLGLVDDVADAPARGWRGHARALARGELSTGAVKAGGTLALALAVLAGGGLTAGEWLLSALLVAATTNLFNLLDLRPGRAVKAFALLGVALVAATGSIDELRAVGAFAGPLLVLGAYDLRERAMLGDTGANVLGALAGVWLVLALGPAAEAVALAVVLALTVYGELRSITSAIDRIPPLRWIDRLGRPAQDAA